MPHLMIRSKIKPEHVDDVEAAVGRLFAALEREQVQGVRYSSSRLPDGVTYVAQLEIADGVENPLPALPEFQEFQQGLGAWQAEPPVAEPLTTIGAYRAY